MSGHCRQYSELISAAIATGGPHIARSSAVKLMRAVRAALHVCVGIWQADAHAQSPYAALAVHVMPTHLDVANLMKHCTA